MATTARFVTNDVFLLSGEIGPVRRLAAVPRIGEHVRLMIAGREIEAQVQRVVWLDPGLGDTPPADVELALARAR